MQPLIDLSGKVAIVTGGTRGIGRATVELLAQAGASVVLTGRKQEGCDSAAAELAEATGATILGKACHAGDKAQLQALTDFTVEKLGRIDILVCNAAANPTFGPLSTLQDDAWEKILQTNVTGPLWLANMVAPVMEQGGGGSIVMLSSIAGMHGNNGIAAYGISKTADAALARNLATELGPKGIRVNAVAPGLIKTDFAKALWEDEKRRTRFNRMVPLGRLGEPRDIAGVVTFLASDLAAYVTGQTYVADGGVMIADRLT